MKIRKDDQVVIITGDDKGPEHKKVLRVLPSKNKIVVEGVNLVYKHVRPGPRSQQGGRLSKEMPIDASNAMLYCSTCTKPTRVGSRIVGNGQKERFCKNCNASLGPLGPAKPQRLAKKTESK